MISQLIALLVLFISIVASSALTMIYGWGLQPKSWLIIVVGFFAQIIFLALSEVIKKEK